MKIVYKTVDTGGIKDINYEIDNKNLYIRWKWQENSDLVYILKTKCNTEDKDISIDDLIENKNFNEKDLKLYTKDEYKEFEGYVEKIRDIDQYKYKVFSAVLEEDHIVLINQKDKENELIICTGKPEIVYEIKETKSFFSNTKKVQIIIYCNMPIKKEVLCYVKKEGSCPISKEDGIALPFNLSRDTILGTASLPEITIKKSEYIKVFISDKERYGGLYYLKQK